MMTKMIENPDKFDVLCGKDKTCVNWPGSKRFRVVIESYRERYAAATNKYDKMMITKEIYESMNQTSSRFLRYNESAKQWEELSVMAARDKIGHSLRFANRKVVAKKSSSTSSNSMETPTTRTATKSTTEEEDDMVDVDVEPHPFPYPPTRTVSVATTNASKNNDNHDHGDHDDDDEKEEYKPFQRFPSRTAYFNAGGERRRSSVRILTSPVQSSSSSSSNNNNNRAPWHREVSSRRDAQVHASENQQQQTQQELQQESSPITQMGSIREGGRRRSSRVHDRKHTVSIGGELWCMMQEQIADWDDHHQNQS